MEDFPHTRVSVITVVRNGASLIRPTIESVLTQTYPHLEYIVLDGDSRDGTQDQVRTYGDRIAKFVSEPDRGISEAFNKAIAWATGDLIILMNAGDVFFSPTTIEDCLGHIAMPLAKIRRSVIYGDTLHVGRFGELLEKADHRNLVNGRSLGHQASFVGAEIYRTHQYDPRLPLSMDFDFWLRCAQDASISFYHIDVVIVRFLVGGVSGAPSTRERAEAYSAIVRILNATAPNEPKILLRAAGRILATRAKLRMRRLIGDQGYRSIKALFGRRDLHW